MTKTKTGTSVILKPQEDRRLRRGHLWVFSNEVKEAPASIQPGDVVQFLTDRGDLLGVGFYNPRSLIAGRLLDRHPVEFDVPFFENRLKQAMELRESIYGGDAYRWVFGESDDLPGLVIDRYGDVCVLSSYCAGMDRLTETIVAAMKSIRPWKAIVLRNDNGARRLEGLEPEVKVLEGELETPHWFDVDGVRMAADLRTGQKTGFFFDQRDNTRRLATYAKEKNILDLFCHTGSVGLALAKAGASRVLGIDQSEKALALARTAAEANGFAPIMSFEKADVMEGFKPAAGRYDMVICDPPSFAPGRKQVPAAVKAYARLNAMAMKSVSGGGLLATSSCSHHIDQEAFRKILSRAAYESGRRVRCLWWGGQAADHPVRLSIPETEYLKFALLYVN